MTKELRGGTAIHASKMPCIDPQKLTLFAYHLIRLSAPSPSRGRHMPPFVLFVSPSSASWHLPHQGEGICRRDGHCPSAKNRCGRLFTSAGQFTTALPSIHASKMPCIDPQKLTLFAYHLIRLSAPSPSRGRLMPQGRPFCVPLIRLMAPSPSRGRLMPQGRPFCVPLIRLMAPSPSRGRHMP